ISNAGEDAAVLLPEGTREVVEIRGEKPLPVNICDIEPVVSEQVGGDRPISAAGCQDLFVRSGDRKNFHQRHFHGVLPCYPRVEQSSIGIKKANSFHSGWSSCTLAVIPLE